MSWHRRTIISLLTSALLVTAVPSASARAAVPEWVRPALRYLVDHGYLNRDSFRSDATMARRAFTRLMTRTFGGGYSRAEGTVTAGEVSRALVRRLGRAAIARRLAGAESPDGWDPGVGLRFGYEVTGRELGLRHDRPTGEESMESSAGEPMRQADIIWAVWQAKTSPDVWAADTLGNFRLGDYDETRRKVVKFALSLVGAPYVWGGEWPAKTPSGYQYGAQAHGGFDCSGFAWYVLRRRTSAWSPNRPYQGWALPERSSRDMAAATRNRLGFRELGPGDLVFFASGGRDAKAADVYHVGIYLGRGWMVHSSGSRAGISLASIGRGSWWHGQIAWGRRIIR
jgi:cell wall-associated NlpC family hydrolase